MVFQEILSAKTLPSYRSLLLRAIGLGHHVDVLYSAAQSIAAEETWVKIPQFLVSLHFPAGTVPTQEEAMKKKGRDFLPSGTWSITVFGWRAYYRSSSGLSCSELRPDEISLIRPIPLLNEACILASRLLEPISEIVLFAEDLGKANFSFLFYAENVAGKTSLFSTRTLEEPATIIDDNIVLFAEKCSLSAIPDLLVTIMNGFGKQVSRETMVEALNTV